MSLQQIADTILDGNYRKRVEAAVLKAAVSIVGEDWQTAGFSELKANKRHNLGVSVLNGDNGKIVAFIKTSASQIGEVADPSTILDATIDSSVSAIWDDIAGVKFGE